MAAGDLLTGPRVLLGPGPAAADPRVLRAMATPLLGQFDPEFTQIMNYAAVDAGMHDVSDSLGADGIGRL